KKSRTFSISVRLTTRSGKSFTAGYRIGWETGPQAVCHSLKAEGVWIGCFCVIQARSRAEPRSGGIIEDLDFDWGSTVRLAADAQSPPPEERQVLPFRKSGSPRE